MPTLSPGDMLKKTKAYAKELKAASRGFVAVGLPAEKVGGKIYGDGMSIISIGAIHEYGSGYNPRRSFLREPFMMNSGNMDKAIASAFKSVARGDRTAKQALGIVGVAATNISKGAFTTRGYGAWPDIKPATKKAKGSSQTLIDTGTLRNSITYVVRGL